MTTFTPHSVATVERLRLREQAQALSLVVPEIAPPEVVARAADWVTEVPARARAVASLAIELGWVVVPTYARGTWRNYTGTGKIRSEKVVDSCTLRVRRGACRGGAVWHDGKWSSAFGIEHGRTPLRGYSTQAAFVEWLKGGP